MTGWKKGADNTLIPEPEKVWYVDLDWAPRNVWMVGKDGAVTRIALARTPNWTITDPDDIKSEWWTWKNPDKPFDNYATINGQRRHLAFDKEHINESKPQDYYEGAIVWTTKGWVMGSPFQARVLAVDRENGSLVFRRPVGRRAVLQDHPRLPLSTWKTSPTTWTARASSGSTRRATAAGSTSACPATRTRTPPASRWPSASA